MFCATLICDKQINVAQIVMLQIPNSQFLTQLQIAMGVRLVCDKIQ